MYEETGISQSILEGSSISKILSWSTDKVSLLQRDKECYWKLLILS